MEASGNFAHFYGMDSSQINAYLNGLEGFEETCGSLGLQRENVFIIKAGEIQMRVPLKRKEKQSTICFPPENILSELKSKLLSAEKIFIFLEVVRLHPRTVSAKNPMGIESKLYNSQPYTLLLYVDKGKWIYFDAKIKTGPYIQLRDNKPLMHFQKKLQPILRDTLGIPQVGSLVTHLFQPALKIKNGSSLLALWVMESLMQHDYESIKYKWGCQNGDSLELYKCHVASFFARDHQIIAGPVPNKEEYMEQIN